MSIPILHFFSFETNFWFDLYQINYHYHALIKWYSKAVTDAYVQRSLDFLFLSFFDSGTKIFWFSWVSTPAPHVSCTVAQNTTANDLPEHHSIKIEVIARNRPFGVCVCCFAFWCSFFFFGFEITQLAHQIKYQ